MEEMKQSAKKLRIIAAILVLLATLSMTFGGMKFEDKSLLSEMESFMDEFDTMSPEQKEEANQELKEEGIDYSIEQLAKDMESMQKIYKDGSISLFDIGFRLSRFVKLYDVLLEVGAIDNSTSQAMEIIKAMCVAVYISIAVGILFVVLLFINKRCFSIIPIVITFLWFGLFYLAKVGSNGEYGVHFLTYLSVLFAIAGCVVACKARGKDKQTNAGMNNPYPYGQPYGMSNQYGMPNQYGVQNQYGMPNQSGMANQYGTQNQYGMPDQNSMANQYGIQNPYGMQDQNGMANQYGSQNQYGTPSQFGTQNPYGMSDQTGMGNQNLYGVQNQNNVQNQNTDQSSGWGNFDPSK